MQRIMRRTPWQRSCLTILMSILIALATGCVAVLSERIRQEADRSLAFVQVRMQPEAYVHRLLIVGGDIVYARHMPGVSLLEVIQKPLDSEDRPYITAQSEGRFMVRCEGYLDPLVYTSGQVITLAGRVLGTHIERIGETDVPYLLLSCVEIYAWSPPVYVVPAYPGIGYLWYWDLWYLDPWYWDPWHRHHHYFRRHRPYHRHR